MGRKDAILKAAIELFAERGFKGTSTSELAKRADVAEGLIFHYFKNKENIFVHILDEMTNAYIEGLEGIIEQADTGLKAIEDIVAFHFRFSKKRSKEFIVIIRDFPFDLMKSGAVAREMIADQSARLSNLIKKCIEQGQKDGSIRDLPAERMGFVFQGMLNGVSRLKMLSALNMPDLSSEVMGFCHRAFARQC